MFEETVEQEVNELLYGGRLIALKKDGGLLLIAICYTLRCLTDKCANKYATTKLPVHSAPIQLDVGAPGLAEVAIYTLRRYAESLSNNHIIVQLDFRNAFNTLRRATMMEVIRRELPELYNFA